jgi:tetratricopeptide (TPR) repeat protein
MKTTIRTILAAAAFAALLAGCAHSPGTDRSAEEIARSRVEATRLASQAREAQQAGKLDRAIELYNQSLTTYDQIPGVRTNLGAALFARGDILNAADTLKDETDLFPEASQQALTNLGIIYLDRGWASEAYDYFERALALAPNEPVALRGAIEASFRSSRTPEQTLDLIRRGLMVERDPRLLEDYRWKQSRLRTMIDERPKYESSNTKPEASR